MSLLTKPTDLGVPPSSNIIDISMVRNENELYYPRASSLYNVCIRQLLLGTKFKLKKTELVGFNRQLTFDIGNALHKWIQNSEAYFGTQRRGIWVCTACGKERVFGKPPTQKCQKCGAQAIAMEYKEIELIMHKPFCVTGHPDLFIEPTDSPGKIRVVELKTMNGEKFAKLATPLIEHVWQIQTYMYACNLLAYELSVRVDAQHGYLVYISKKETRGELPIKIFPIQKDDRVLSEIKDKLRVYSSCLRDDTLCEPDAECVKSAYSGWKARSCPALKLCKT